MDVWDRFVGNEELYFRDSLHLSGKGAAVFAEGLSGAVASGLGKVRHLNDQKKNFYPMKIMDTWEDLQQVGTSSRN